MCALPEHNENKAEQSLSHDLSKSLSPADASASENDSKKSLAFSMLSLSSNQRMANERTGIALPCFSNVSISVYAKEIWSISSNVPLSVRLLCQAAGNMLSYRSGMLRYGTLATIRSRKTEVPHIFYIDTHKMLFTDKTVLQQLIFASGNKQKFFGAAEMQSKMLSLLESVGMGYIALSLITDLHDSEKLLLELLIASESDSMLVICDAVDYSFPKPEIDILTNIANRFRYLGKALVIGTLQAELIEAACDHTIYLIGGEPAYCGSVEELNKKADRVAFILKDSNSKLLGIILSTILPGWRIKVSDEKLYLYNFTDKQMNIEEFYTLLAKNKLSPEQVLVNKGSVANSFEELVEQYDLQSQSV
jgi:ABC-2 type transport system ATP-binding protein